MNLTRIQYLRGELENGTIDLAELSEIEEAFKDFPEEDLRDLRENAMASDMLDELETKVTRMERVLFDYISENYGHNEAEDPCYAISPLAEHLNKEFNLS